MAEATVKSTGDAFDPGTTLNNRYRIQEKLGQGGMGTVFRGEHIFMERPVAIKVLHPHLVTNQDFLQRFLHEARVNCRIAHRNAVTLYDFGVEGQVPYLVFEFVEGLTLREVLEKDGRFSVERFLNIISQVGAALGHAHTLGIVHRDLKPDNIMIAHRGGAQEYACVLDFGIAKALHQPAGEERTVVTQMGMVMGTPQYLSPEQALEKELDGRSDIYSLGVIMYEMLIGAVPFSSPSSPLEILVQHLSVAPTPMRTLKPELNLPPHITEAVMKCLSKEPDERFQSIDALLDALTSEIFGTGAVADSGESKKEPQDAPVPEKSPPSKNPPYRALAIGLGAVAICAAGLFAIQSQRNADSPPEETTATVTEEHKVEPPAPPAETPLTVPPVAVIAPPVAVIEPPVAPPEPPPEIRVEKSEEMFGVLKLTGGAVTALEEHFIQFPVAAPAPPAIVEETLVDIKREVPTEAPPSIGITQQIEQRAEVAPVETNLPPPSQEQPALTPEIAALVAEDIPLTSLSREVPGAQFESRFAAAKKLFQKKDYLEAARAYQPLVRARGDNLNARLSLGTCYLKLGAFEAAEREFTRVLKVEPQFAPAVYMRAAYFAAKNEPAPAMENLTRALKLFPGAKKWLAEDREFDSLKGNPDFEKLLAAK